MPKKKNPAIPAGLAFVKRPFLRKELEDVAARCMECGLCVKECRFLQKYGTPGRIALSYDPESRKDQVMPFECSLCRLCAAVCPPKIGLNPASLFLEMRREAVDRGVGGFPEHAVILDYERRGASKRYSLRALPEGCDTVLFPGCALSGTRPDRVKDLFEHLGAAIARLGIILDCCAKPSHDLGREKHFHALFGELRAFLVEKGVRTVLVACPNCHQVFGRHGEGLIVRTVYEVLAESGPPAAPRVSSVVTVHDPCATRFDKGIHDAVRRLVADRGARHEEMKHLREKTLCCGEGGSVGFLSPDFSKAWSTRRGEEAGGKRIVTYCAGCAAFLGAVAPVSHVLDLVFQPEKTLAGTVRVARAPWTYFNRLRLKNWFRKRIQAGAVTERTFVFEDRPRKRKMFSRLFILALLVGAIAAIRLTGAAQYLDQEKLRELIQGYGAWAPAIYMLSYSVAPAFFLPGLPFTIAGGVLFGPLWGVLYALTSATIGACMAFLVSRHIGRDWIAGKLKSPRWRQLDTMTEEQGWKAVAFTRLIPLFPFNLLNYAFGLTKVKFTHYAAATFLGMLPACIAFIVFSSSLLDVIRGNVTPGFLAGISLVAGVSLIPFLYKRIKGGKTKK